MSAGKRIGRIAFGRRSNLLSRKRSRAVPYAAEGLERRVMLAWPYYG